MQKSSQPSPGLVLALISLPIFIGALDLTVVSAVLPHVVLEMEIPLQTGLDDAAWMVTGYLLVYSVSMTFMGRLSDLVGRRRVYLWALVIFAVGSYLVAVAHLWPTQLVLRIYYLFADGRPDTAYITLYVLIAARMVQAFGAGTMVPVGMALVGDLYPPEQRARPLGVIAAVDTAGWVVGHLYGGIVARFFSWQVIFWLNLPFCLLAFTLIWLVLRGQVSTRSAGSMDWWGAVLATIALSLLNIGLGAGTENSTSTSLENQAGLPAYAVPVVVAALVFLGLFLWRQRVAQHPLLDLRLFRERNYLAAGLANFLIGFSLFIAIANVPLFINTLVAQTVEQGAWDSGWMLCALTVPLSLASAPGGWLTDRRGYRLPAMIGICVAVLGFLAMTSWNSQTAYATMVPQLILAGIGIGLTMAPIAAAVVNAAPADQRGVSSALVILFRLVGMTVGVSSITTFGLWRAQKLSLFMLPAAPTLQQTVAVGIKVMEQVISETFFIAGMVALVAILPIFFLKDALIQKER